MWLLFILYGVLVIIICIGAGFISNVVFNSSPEALSAVGITTIAQRNISQMTSVLFWVVFIPIAFIPIALFAGYSKYIF